MDERNELLDSLDEKGHEQLMMALDTNEPDPHGNEFEVDDHDIESNFLGFSQEKRGARDYFDLSDYPDFSDEKLNDYILDLMKGKEVPKPNVIDLDTAPDYVNFVNVSIKNMKGFEGQFDTESKYEAVKKLLKE